jgi:hypothetical protein
MHEDGLEHKPSGRRLPTRAQPHQSRRNPIAQPRPASFHGRNLPAISGLLPLAYVQEKSLRSHVGGAGSSEGGRSYSLRTPLLPWPLDPYSPSGRSVSYLKSLDGPDRSGGSQSENADLQAPAGKHAKRIACRVPSSGPAPACVQSGSCARRRASLRFFASST